MGSKKDYQPISCSYYDHLEALATLRKEVLILYESPKGGVLEVKARIRDFFVREKVEYMVLEDGTTIRLDRLIEVDGEALARYC